MSASGEVVNLSETAIVLELLLQYMYHPQLDLKKVNFEDLFSLAEAAEKYKVSSAVDVCKVQLRKR